MLQEQCSRICTSCFLREANYIFQNNFSQLFFFLLPSSLFFSFQSHSSAQTKTMERGYHVGSCCWNLCSGTPTRWCFSVKTTNYENDHWKGQIIWRLEWTFLLRTLLSFMLLFLGLTPLMSYPSNNVYKFCLNCCLLNYFP